MNRGIDMSRALAKLAEDDRSATKETILSLRHNRRKRLA